MSMFGALNRFIARLDADPSAVSKPSNTTAYGFQVLRNASAEVPIEPWFDFIIGINGHNIDNADPNLFATEVRNCAGSNIELGIWSAKGSRIRSQWIPVAIDTPSLGLSLQWMPLNSTDDIWHVLDVAPNSPSDLGGLLPYSDYIIGSPEGLLKGESSMGELVEDYVSQSLRLYVYNHEYNVTRIVTVEPSRTWGGGGLLGCMFGYGALHKIPPPLDEPPQGPGETLFETARVSSDMPDRQFGTSVEQEPPSRADTVTPQYLIPADLALGSPGPAVEGALSPPPSSKGASAGSNKKPRHQNKVPLNMDEFLQEGEAKSREEDSGMSKSHATSLPPPPKAGAVHTAAAVAPPSKPQVPEPDKKDEPATDVD